MKYFVTSLVALFIFASSQAQPLPKPNHLLIVILENRDDTEIVGNPLAPYINSLLTDTTAAVFTKAYGMVSGSQPNYLYLYSGASQGMSGDAITTVQFTNCNLGASLISGGYTFAGYSEDMPSVGYLGTTYANYARKHNPWSNWQGSGTNQIPATCNLPFSSFPTNYDSLPTVSIVVPNELDNMHTPSDATGIAPGDTWLKNHLDSYIQWCKKNNSMFMLMYDESSADIIQHILVFFIGQQVKKGSYSENINIVSLLSTIEDMYSLPYCASSATTSPITDCWTTSYHTGINQISGENTIKIWPVPATNLLHVGIKAAATDHISFTLTDLSGKVVMQSGSEIAIGENDLTMQTRNLASGMYFIKLAGQNINTCQKLLIEN